MNLSVSPDLNALYCYAIVLVCGLISARVQIYKRLSESNVTGIWLDPVTWLLFAIYLAIPLSLFWFLDRTGAINDTSLFAAVLIGAAYPVVLAGSVGAIKAPEGFDAVLGKPIERFTDAVVKRLVKRAARNDAAFEQYIVMRMGDAKLYDAILAVTRDKTLDTQKLDASLTAIDAAAAAQGGGGLPGANPVQPGTAPNQANDLIVRRKARTIYLYLSSIPEFESHLRKAGVFRLRDLLFTSPVYRNRLVASVVSVFMLAAVASAGAWVFVDDRIQLNYLTWRLKKANNTAVDRFRAGEMLRAYFADSGMCRVACKRLAYQLRSPELPGDRVDLILGVFLENYASAKEEDRRHIEGVLVDCLRIQEADSRAHVHHALAELAALRDPEFRQEDLYRWEPGKGDSLADLERRIHAWHGVWDRLAAAEARTRVAVSASAREPAAATTQIAGPAR